MSDSLTIDDIVTSAQRGPIIEHAAKTYLNATLAKPSQALINVCMETYVRRLEFPTVHMMSHAMMEAVIRQMLAEIDVSQFESSPKPVEMEKAG